MCGTGGTCRRTTKSVADFVEYFSPLFNKHQGLDTQGAAGGHGNIEDTVDHGKPVPDGIVMDI